MKPFLFSILILVTSSLVLTGQNTEFQIKFKAENFTPEVVTNFSKALELKSAEKTQGFIYRVIQFNSIPTTEEKQVIENFGIELLSYIPNKAFIAKLPNTLSGIDLSKLNIRSMFPIADHLKLSPQLTKGNLPAWAISDNEIKLNVKYFSRVDKERLIEQLSRENGNVLFELEEINMLTLQCDLDQIKHLSKNPLIQWIEPISPPSTPDSSEATVSSRSNALNTSYGAGRRYDGSGVVVGIPDDGVVGPHIDFTGRIIQNSVENAGKHGDMTSGILTGAGNLDPTIAGMAPGAELQVFRIGTLVFLSSQFHILEAVENFNNLGLVITSTSYSQGFGGEYNESTEFIDKQVNETPELMHVIAAGNSAQRDHGYGAGVGWGNISGGMKAGKNVICVGNVNENDELFITSSRGPAADGRIKPDLCAQGEDYFSTDENNTFQPANGTSAACPNIAGVSAQLYQAYREMNNGDNPESGFIKATMLNTAEDLGNIGPDYQHGWGRINGLKAVRIIEEERYIKGEIGQSENTEHSITVPDNVSQVRIMTYWTDVNGSPSAAVALVNDINMEVIAPDDSSHRPWVLDPTPDAQKLDTPATKGIDNLNNMEQVSIDNPAAGSYTINLNGFAIPQGPQSYYVVYDFIYDGVEITYPLGGEGFVPGEIETIRWDASISNESFVLEYSQDGGNSFENIQTVPASTRIFRWTVPNIMSDKVIFKISRGNSVSVSDTSFTIVEVPQNLNIVRVCPDFVELNWEAVDDVSHYEISILGKKYMDSIAVSTTNSYQVTGLNPNDDHWFSVRSLVENGKGRRAIAINKPPGSQGCMLNNDIKMTEILSNVNVISDCRDLGNTGIAVNIINTGMVPASGITLNYQINNEAAVTETLPTELQVGEDVDYVFDAQGDFSGFAKGDISVWVSWPGDEDLSNDTISTTYQVMSNLLISDFPYTQNFQYFTECSATVAGGCEQYDCFLSEGWNNYVNTQDDDIDWRTESDGTNTSATGPTFDYDLGNAQGQFLYLEGTSCTFREGVLLTPCFDLTSMVTADAQFAYHMLGTGIGELHVDIITEDGEIRDIVNPIIGAQGDSWRPLNIDLTPYVGGIINLKIRGTTGETTRADMAIDAFVLNADSGSSSTKEKADQEAGISIYPNPTSGHFTITFAQQSRDKNLKIEVFDVLGRLCYNLKKENSTDQLTLDATDINSGVFFVKLSGDNFEYIKKLIKH